MHLSISKKMLYGVVLNPAKALISNKRKLFDIKGKVSKFCQPSDMPKANQTSLYESSLIERIFRFKTSIKILFYAKTSDKRYSN